MKIFTRKVLLIIARLFSIIYPFSLSLRFIAIRDFIYTLWIRNFLGEVGDSSSISYPCSLQGSGQKSITIGNHTCIQSHAVIGCWAKYGDQTLFPSIKIGDYCCIGEYNHITACNEIVIGNGLLTGRFVYIGDNAHGGLSYEEANVRPIMRNLVSKGRIVIGNNVWIGDKVTILSGVKLGNNVIVGANSVVTQSFPDNCMIAGVPAKILKEL